MQRIFADLSHNSLGTMLDDGGIRPSPTKLDAAAKMPRSTVKDFRAFLGLTGYLRNFVKGRGMIAACLANLHRKNEFSSPLSCKMSIE